MNCGDSQTTRRASEAEPASAHADGVPGGVDALLRRLLAKEPRERLGYAEDVARELHRLGAQADRQETPGRAKSYLHRPQLAGRDVARWVEQNRPGLPVLAISGDAGASDAREFARVIGKPVRRANLLETVAQVLSRGS